MLRSHNVQTLLRSKNRFSLCPKSINHILFFLTSALAALTTSAQVRFSLWIASFHGGCHCSIHLLHCSTSLSARRILVDSLYTVYVMRSKSNPNLYLPT
jgi:hypothetical protein